MNAPSHKIIQEVVARSIHRERLERALLNDPVGSPENYYDLLYPYAKNKDIWETEYSHELDGENAVAEWTRGSALKPLLDLLDRKEAEKFYQEYSEEINCLYPRRSDGKTLYPFRRLFAVVRQ